MEKNLEQNEDSCIKIDLCTRDLSITRRPWWRNRSQRIVIHKVNLQKFHADVVINTRRVEDSETRLKDCFVVTLSTHKIRHAKFDAADILSYWIAKYPWGLSFFYDVTSCDLLDAPIPEFAAFCDHRKGVGGLVIERHAKLGTLKSDCVGERGAQVGSFRSDL